jgi:putative addiction module component (TIGR02574 family)
LIFQGGDTKTGIAALFCGSRWYCRWASTCQTRVMTAAEFAELLKLPPGDRAELAISLWASLTDNERDAEFELREEDLAELDRRWSEHVAHPESAIPWSELQRKLHHKK